MATRTFARAAGVSPPWFGFALATATGFCGLINVPTAHSAPPNTAGLRQPLLVHDVRLVGDKRSRQREFARSQERWASARRGSDSRLQHPGGSVQVRSGHRVSPPWFGFALATATGFCALTSVPIARSRPKPRLAYASRSRLDALMPTWKCVFHLRARYVSQCWLTPTALVHDRCPVPFLVWTESCNSLHLEGVAA